MRLALEIGTRTTMEAKIPEYAFSRGLQEAEARIRTALDESDERPILVAIYGQSNSGKTYLIDRLGAALRESGLDASGGAHARRSMFERLREDSRTLKEVTLFHCGWERYANADGVVDFANEDPNYLAETLAGRTVNLNICMYNSCMDDRKPNGAYDFIINNTASRVKPPLTST